MDEFVNPKGFPFLFNVSSSYPVIQFHCGCVCINEPHNCQLLMPLQGPEAVLMLSVSSFPFSVQNLKPEFVRACLDEYFYDNNPVYALAGKKFHFRSLLCLSWLFV